MKIFRIILILTIGLFMVRCSEEAVEIEQPVVQEELILKEDIDELIINSLQTSNEFHWKDASDEVIWSALAYSDNIITVGYKPASEGDITNRMSSINIQAKPWSEARRNVVNEVLATVNELPDRKVKEEDIKVQEHGTLPFVKMYVTDLEVIKRLRTNPNVRYVEPLGYKVDFPTDENSREASSKGCDNSADNGITSSDYHSISPNAKASWNYDYMRIRDAWNHSTGSGISVGLIDTGISSGQSKLNGEFNSGYSSGRFVHKYGTYVSSWWWWASPDGPNDKCGHGTAMAGVIAAPRSNSGSSTGVAYNANLVSVRGTGDVVINGGSEKTGVSDALVLLGNRSDVKIISMSIGDVFWNSEVADAIRYAYGKGKLIFAAAGTSTSWTNWYGVIFPASMSETVAVTGVKESGYTRCDVCHSGDKVDFTVVMERSNGRHPLSLAMSGSNPSTVGGSSVATATAAGIAALVWAKNPGLSRDQVLTRLRVTADLYPGKSSQFGLGTLDAYAAVTY